MTPIHFPEANTRFGPPAGYDESQVATIHVHQRIIEGGSCDGWNQVIAAWQPSPEDLERINAGGPIFISMVGGLAPHFLSTDFESCKNIS